MAPQLSQWILPKLLKKAGKMNRSERNLKKTSINKFLWAKSDLYSNYISATHLNFIYSAPSHSAYQPSPPSFLHGSPSTIETVETRRATGFTRFKWRFEKTFSN